MSRSLTSLAVNHADHNRWELVDAILHRIVARDRSRAVERLLTIFEQACHKLRVRATIALGKLGPCGRNALADLVDEDDPQVRVEAAWALLRLGESQYVLDVLPRHTEALAPRLVAHGDVGIRLLCYLEPDDLDDYWHASHALAKAPAEHHALIAELAKTSRVAHFAHRIQQSTKVGPCPK